MTTHTYRVDGMSCDHCVRAITDEVGAVEGVRSVQVDLDAAMVTVEGGSDGAIRGAIDHAGFDVR